MCLRGKMNPKLIIRRGLGLEACRCRLIYFPRTQNLISLARAYPPLPIPVVLARFAKRGLKTTFPTFHRKHKNQEKPLIVLIVLRSRRIPCGTPRLSLAALSVCWQLFQFCGYASNRASPGITPAGEITTSAAISRIRTIRRPVRPAPPIHNVGRPF